MERALALAAYAAEQDEVPIGAVVVNPENGEIVSEAYNLSEHVADASAHAEILAIRKACEKLKCNRLRGMDLYVTLEPCTMCAAAISFARIQNLYFGAVDAKGGAVVSGVKFYDSPTCHHRPEVQGGIMERECGQILKDFFKAKREKVKLLDKKS
ncbi:MAG: nucleoside deaminase [Alphaproteobacteria bacterium]|jgi:tRNA-specific adenosine deaminase|nr:MAG: tRNA-specific adenosine deaminase [Azospirillum sp.]